MATTTTPDTNVEDVRPSPDLSPTISDKERAAPASIHTEAEADKQAHPYRWLQIAAGMLLQLNTWSMINAYGVFQAYYTTVLLPQESESKIAWIGSMYVFLMLSGGFVTAPFFDAGYMFPMLVAGTFLTTFGLMMTSLCDEYWQLMLAQGIVVGIGSGFFIVPSLAIPSEWYPTPKGRALALGAVAFASAFGGILYPIMFRYIQQDAGWRWAVRSIAFVVLATTVPGSLLMRYKDPIKERRQLLDTSLLREKPYLMLAAGAWFGFATIYVPLNWLQKYYMTERQDTTSDLIFWLLPIAMASGLPGRLIPNAMGIKFGALNVLVAMTLISAILSFCWIAVQSKAAIIVFAIVYGFFAGGWIAVAPAALLSAAPHQRNIGTRIGGVLAFASLGALAGLPLAGQILDSTHSYTGLQIFSGCMLLLSFACLFAARTALLGFTFSGPAAKWRM